MYNKIGLEVMRDKKKHGVKSSIFEKKVVRFNLYFNKIRDFYTKKIGRSCFIVTR